jgi:hypothetical protein
MRQVRLAVSVVVVLLAVTAPAGAGSRAPTHLHGVALGNDTGLRLLVANDPPFVVDVDSGRVTPVPGVPPVNGGVMWVVSVAGRKALIAGAPTGTRTTQLYGVLDRGARVASLGRGIYAVGAASGQSVWIRGAHDASGCAVRQVAFDGHAIRAPRAFPCGFLDAAGALGLAVARGRIIDPHTNREVFTTRAGILAVASRRVLLVERSVPMRFTLVDTATGVRKPIPWPEGAGGLSRPAVDPRGRFIALAFGIPSTSPQILDIWILDTESGRLTHPPGMPTLVGLKFTSMEWTDDGRLVILADRRDGEGTVVVWRPGQRRLALKTLPMPEPNTGSPSFAPIR